ncbi:MAG: hypothetical protein HC877_04985 [Thioploca sp.]|nr:hypothetical protein [Thioploca sp.]
MNTPTNFKKLIIKLNQKNLPESIEKEFLRLGQSAFDYLFDAIEANQLTERQTVNAFYILFNLTREYCYGEQNRLLKLALQKMTDNSSKLIKTEAAIIVIRLAELGKKFPALCLSQDIIIGIMEKIQSELPQPAYSYVEKYLATQKSEIFKAEIKQFSLYPYFNTIEFCEIPFKKDFPEIIIY